MELDMACPASTKPAKMPIKDTANAKLYETRFDRFPVVSPELFHPNTKESEISRRKSRRTSGASYEYPFATRMTNTSDPFSELSAMLSARCRKSLSVTMSRDFALISFL